MSALLWILIIVITGLNIADVYTTKKGLDMGLFEKNPFMLLIISKFGINGLIAVKGFAIVLVINLAIWVLPTYAAIWMLTVLNLFYAVVGWRNWSLIKEREAGGIK